jgi:hypothetical protein
VRRAAQAQDCMPTRAIESLRGWEYFERVGAAPQKAPDLGAKRSHSLAMASICNDEQGAFGVMSGHDRKTLSL